MPPGDGTDLHTLVLLFPWFLRLLLWFLEAPLKRLVKDATSQALNDVLRLEATRAAEENRRNPEKVEEFLSNNLVGGYLKLIVRLGVHQELNNREMSKKWLEAER